MPTARIKLYTSPGDHERARLEPKTFNKRTKASTVVLKPRHADPQIYSLPQPNQIRVAQFIK